MNDSETDNINAYTTVVFRFINDSYTLALRHPRLFQEEEIKILSSIMSISNDEKVLLMRLLCRQRKPRRLDSISYTNIDTAKCLTNLVERQLLLNSDQLKTVEMLDNLNAKEVKQLCTVFGLCKKLTKKDSLKTLEKSLKTCGFLTSRNSREAAIRKWIISNADKSYCVLKSVCELIDRMLLISHPIYIYSAIRAMSTCSWSAVFSALLLTLNDAKLLDTNVDSEYYPLKTVEDVKNLYDAYNLLFDILNLQSTKQHKDVTKLISDKWDYLQSIVLKEDHRNYVRCCRRYTAGGIYCRCIWIAVDSFQKAKMYLFAAKMVEFVLKTEFRKSARGRMYERLCIIYKHHLRNNSKYNDILNLAINDNVVVRGDRYLIEKRCDGCKLMTPEENHIDALYLNQSGNSRNVLMLTNGDTISYLNVEEYTLQYYVKNRQMTKGIHSEGRILSTLFGVYFWDVIYAVDDKVFIDSLQEFPIDMFSPDFYQRMRKFIDERLNLFETSKNGWATVFEQNWTEYYSKQSSIVHWDLFKDVDEFMNVINSFNPKSLQGLLIYIIQQHGSCFGGVPDLFLWDNTNGVMFVEVKSPNDKLSANQIVWIHVLRSLEIKCEVARVDVGSKQI
ncbi:hypothetical protein GJ496_003282 [Pomphorhynchus laevis]|nr:hypothetical protein GJ496_003282 [Pomphorhynchus laevis]